MTQDTKEALLALSLESFGLTKEFAEQFSNNMENFMLLPETTRKKIADQFGKMAFARSCEESIARKHSEDANIRLVQWLKGVNFLLAMTSPKQVA